MEESYWSTADTLRLSSLMGARQSPGARVRVVWVARVYEHQDSTPAGTVRSTVRLS